MIRKKILKIQRGCIQGRTKPGLVLISWLQRCNLITPFHITKFNLSNYQNKSFALFHIIKFNLSNYQNNSIALFHINKFNLLNYYQQRKLLYTSPHPEISNPSIHPIQPLIAYAATSVSDSIFQNKSIMLFPSTKFNLPNHQNNSIHSIPLLEQQYRTFPHHQISPLKPWVTKGSI